MAPSSPVQVQQEFDQIQRRTRSVWEQLQQEGHPLAKEMDSINQQYSQLSPSIAELVRQST